MERDPLFIPTRRPRENENHSQHNHISILQPNSALLFKEVSRYAQTTTFMLPVTVLVAR